MQKHKGSKNRLSDDAAQVGDGQSAKPELKRKEYEAELRKLHVELVKLQEWVRHEGQKVCIVFEGRDGAGKGGVIKAITARVSPRVFRVVAPRSSESKARLACSRICLSRLKPRSSATPSGARI